MDWPIIAVNERYRTICHSGADLPAMHAANVESEACLLIASPFSPENHFVGVL
jgi:hypothetical protein